MKITNPQTIIFETPEEIAALVDVIEIAANYMTSNNHDEYKEKKHSRIWALIEQVLYNHIVVTEFTAPLDL